MTPRHVPEVGLVRSLDRYRTVPLRSRPQHLAVILQKCIAGVPTPSQPSIGIQDTRILTRETPCTGAPAEREEAPPQHRTHRRRARWPPSPTAVPAQASPPGDKDVTAVMFEWKFSSVAKACTDTLGPAVTASSRSPPPQEHIQGGQWWTSYQPVSYRIAGRPRRPRTVQEHG